MNTVITFKSLSRPTLALVAYVSVGQCLLAACEDDEGPVVTDAATADGPMTTPDAGTPDATRPEAGAEAGPDAAPAAPDIDIAVLRLNGDGTRDTSFGSNGIAKIDFGPGNASNRDALWGATLDAQDRLLLFGSKKGADTRIDSDRVVARLQTSGALDTNFGMGGFHILNIANLNDNARHGLVQPDGKIVVSGYTSQPTGVGTQSANRIVLLRLLDTGMPDTTFGTGGVVNSAPFVPAMPDTTMWGMAEAYSVTYLANGGYVTTGYGRSAPMGTVDVVSFRFGADGKRDMTWAGGTGGVVLDLIGADDRGRNLATVANDGIVVVGSGKPTSATMDSLVLKLQADGTPDPAFGTNGYKLYDLGRAGDEPFYGVAVSADKNWVVATGYAGETAPTDVDDDASLLLLPVGAGGGTEVAKLVPISESEQDRFWAAAFDAGNKAYGAGFVREGADSLMVVARFNLDGTPDTTFGMGGVVKVNVTPGGGAAETARSVVIQSDGKVVVAGVAEVP
jgi:uncharacterized delta-60 repeat protein